MPSSLAYISGVQAIYELVIWPEGDIGRMPDHATVNKPVISTEDRKELARLLALLAMGKITTDDFENVDLDEHPDAAVRDIWRWGCALFPEWDVLLPSRVNLDRIPEVRILRILERCLIFLHTDQAYRWPSLPATCWCPWERLLWPLDLLGVVLFLVTSPVGFLLGEGFGLMTCSAASFLLLTSFGIRSAYERYWWRKHFRGKTGLLFTAWPFASRDEYLAARQVALRNISEPIIIQVLEVIEEKYLQDMATQ